MTAGFLKGTDLPLSQTYRLALLDLDGVVYRGADPVEHAAQGIKAAVQAGMAMAYTTNNPSRYPSVVADQLRGFGLALSDDQVITSGIVGARMLRKHLPAGAKVLVIGGDHLRDEIRANGMRIADSSDDDPQAVIQSWYPALTGEDLNQACYAIEHGARYFVTNRDLTIPRERGIAPGNGALQLPVIAATGQEPEDSAGKPEPAIYDEARRLFSTSDEPVPAADSLPVGDRLDTDIEAADRGGYDSLVVLTGVATPQAIITARPDQRPTYIAQDLRGLTRPQPEPLADADGAWTCGGSRARLDDGAVTLTSVDENGKALDPASQLDALRAAACAVWSAMDDGLDPSGLSIPDFHLNQ
ncbi:haloacid dehalogenase-like hydrolase [Bifidobacterium actinocoloniiforme DSM 22766]|uniref:Haloacid dehalogenase-like hydrolase n=1 Tax=Bifidobacterium actinocoloniiforme DSM 22766 TaxID=1437605 RepID=A0A086Z122_9BIFI|nr:HAD-IIA family hydrolase [Bifidobacterium actinocoloniiforme]AKV55398.1 hypothetical protein AB656_03230 [Bifidobacterium actinocoloniiforme DSM 22766]KFI40222.1 haloacid dehalogenase-like hydrolase [Bifidobacterium actinocoloniiforme DSM 22766]